jgi:hypothetical protein
MKLTFRSLRADKDYEELNCEEKGHVKIQKKKTS